MSAVRKGREHPVRISNSNGASSDLATMNNDPNHSRIPEEKVQTSRGCLYPPPKQSVQILFLVAAFFTALLLGWGVSGIQRDLSEIATGVLCFVFLLVF